MKKIIILFFGTSKALERLKYDLLSTGNIEYVLCDIFNKIRGRNFDGYIVHYSASDSLQKEVRENENLLEYLIQKQVK